MTQPLATPVATPEEAADPAHTERARRILDAAGELLVAWGYRRVTIDEVARRAGVGKGTVYLHWKTKEALFLVVLLRAKAAAFGRHIARMREEPQEVLPSRMLRTMYLDLQADPVGRAMFVGDSETLGRLAEISARELGALADEGRTGLLRHFRLLRDAGAMRTDIDVDAQFTAFSAVSLGFFGLQPLGAPYVSENVRTGADTLEYIVRATLETGTGDIASTAPEVIALYQHLDDLCRQEITRQLRR